MDKPLHEQFSEAGIALVEAQVPDELPPPIGAKVASAERITSE
ncbi:hypothetical protein SEA_HEXBUG_32 [Gordonia phage Hexbug]|nr:hypothetical protein SEA_ORLA_32 [Gordonia phage Orla]UVK62946.1 hypothetical protein SEA_HEXBUG_32 [Gordonia phage Hexbug]WNN96123.1 hypothetical protein SEA_NODIGI_32 [Gordonia phage Nodigi]